MREVPNHNTQDQMYKTIDGIDIPLRILLPTAGPSTPLPTLVYVHGGSFTMGQHYVPTPSFAHLFLSNGWAIVSVAHRFLPHVLIYDQTSDIGDAVAFLRRNKADILDLDTWALAGHSSGACLTGAALCLGLFEFPPSAWINSAGTADFTVEMYNPSYSEDERQPYDPRRLPRIPAHSPIATGYKPGVTHEELRALWKAPDHQFTGDEDKQLEYAEKMCNLGPDGLVPPDGHGVTLLRELFRAESFQTEEAYRAECRRLSPHHAVMARTFPRIPVYLLQGEEDVWTKPEWQRTFLRSLQTEGYTARGSFIPGMKHDEVVFMVRPRPKESLISGRTPVTGSGRNTSSQSWTFALLLGNEFRDSIDRGSRFLIRLDVPYQTL